MTAPALLRPIERLVFFTDAVVAIAMTLLILPLLEAVSEAARDGMDTVAFLRAYDGQLIAFALSFVIIALFWRGHDHLFEHVQHQTAWLFRLNVVWMFSIVWLPVATAMVGAMETDPAQLALYIGTMLATSIVMAAMQAVILGNRGLVAPGHPLARVDLAPTLANCVLFAVALVLALAVPGVQFWSLLVLLLSDPLERLLRWRLA